MRSTMSLLGLVFLCSAIACAQEMPGGHHHSTPAPEALFR